MRDVEWIERFRQVIVGDVEPEPGDVENIMLTLCLYRAVENGDVAAVQKDPTFRKFVATLCRRCRKDCAKIKPKTRPYCAPCTVFRARQRLGTAFSGGAFLRSRGAYGWVLRAPEVKP